MTAQMNSALEQLLRAGFGGSWWLPLLLLALLALASLGLWWRARDARSRAAARQQDAARRGVGAPDEPASDASRAQQIHVESGERLDRGPPSTERGERRWVEPDARAAEHGAAPSAGAAPPSAPEVCAPSSAASARLAGELTRPGARAAAEVLSPPDAERRPAATPPNNRRAASAVADLETARARPALSEAGTGGLPALSDPKRTRYPLVLVHGVMGFDRLAFGPLRGEYFRGVREALVEQGFEVHVVRVDPLAPIRVRASQLARQLLELKAPRVNLVAHSMGGLDARYAIAHLGLAAKVASLTTIGTPHQGTPIADHGTRWLGEGLGLRRLARVVGADAGAFWDLTTRHMQRFNDLVPDAGGVFYASVLSVGGPVHPLLRATHGWLARKHGPSDGLVPVDSQRWGTVISEVEADHWAQVGWGGEFDAPSFYTGLAGSLRERGL